MVNRAKLDRGDAETVAIQAVAFLAADPARLGRFLAATGIGPAEIRAAARDPNGIRLEFFHGPARAAPHRSALMPSGFLTGEEGMGHIFLFVDDAERSVAFYRDVLGLRISDYVDATLGPNTIHAIFFHANARHHSLAMTAAKAPKRLHHFMLEVNALDDVGAAFDRSQDGGAPILLGLGRHPNDRMISFYGVTPAGFAFEIGHGGLKVDDATWPVRTYHAISEWGHRPGAGGAH